MALTETGARTITHSNAGVIQMIVKLAGTVKLGDPIGMDAGGTGYVKADADNAAGPIDGELIAMNNGDDDDFISVATEAEISGFTGGTAGALVYASATAGEWTETKPDAVVGDAQSPLGRIQVDGTTIFVKTHPGALGYVYKTV